MKAIKHIAFFLLVVSSHRITAQECNTKETNKRRTQVTEMTSPNSYIVQMTMKRGKSYNGTAFFIHPRVLLTAGHNLRKRPQFIFTRVKRVTLRFGAIEKKKHIHYLKLKTTQNDNIYTLETFNRHYSVYEDYGIIILPDDSAYQKVEGHFKLSIYNDTYLNGKFINVAGYPGDKPSRTQWQDSTQSHYRNDGGVLKYDFKTEHGLSGAPIWFSNTNGENEVFAIHTKGGIKTGCTTATIVTTKIYNDIVKFCLSKGINLKE